jgi:hypothetical protein
LPYRKRSLKLGLQPPAGGFLPRITLKSVAWWVKHHRRLVQFGFLALAVINTYFAYIVWPQSHLLGLASGAIALLLLIAVVFAS